VAGLAAAFVARRAAADLSTAAVRNGELAPAPKKAEEQVVRPLPPVVQVVDINPKQNSKPSGLITVKDTLYFAAAAGVHSQERWKCTLTQKGPVAALVKDIHRGFESSNPTCLTNVNGKLFFLAEEEGVRGTQLWKSDGTEAGTVIVKHIKPGPNGTIP